MEVLILTSFVSVVLAAGGVALFVWSARERTFDQSDRLALLPLDEPDPLRSRAAPSAALAVAESRPSPPNDSTEKSPS
jgi:cbb3-type cytochrome oxidase maturation protein